MNRQHLPLLLLLSGCRAPIQITSPGENASVATPWMPLALYLPKGPQPTQVRVALDGADITDPLGIVRAREKGKGGGVDYMSALDLADLSPGEHTVTFTVDLPRGRARTLERSFVVRHPPARLDLTVLEDGQPATARVVVLNPEGQPLSMYPRTSLEADVARRDTQLHHAHAVGGKATLHLAPGPYTVVAWRGIRNRLDAQQVDLKAGAQSLTFHVDRTLPTPGWWAADLHVHSGRSADSFVPHRPRFREVAASGLDAFVLTDHNEVVDPKPILDALGLEGVVGIPGIEARIGPKTDGHFCAFPLSPEGPLPDDKPVDPALHWDAWRARQVSWPSPQSGTDLVLQLNHPRGIQFRPATEPKIWTHALFTHRGYRISKAPGEGKNGWMTARQPDTGTTPLDFQVLEVMNRFSYAVWRNVRRDWFNLMQQGWFHTGTGNTDAHSIAVDTLGIPTTLVQAGEGAFDGGAFVRAIQQGRVTMSTGPIVDLLVTTDEATGGPGSLLKGRQATATVTVRAVSWVPVSEVRLVVDGEVVQTEKVQDTPRDADGLLSVTFTWPVPGAGDSWVLAEAGWPLDDPSPFPPAVGGLYAVLAPGAAPVGFTNPVRLDRDGDGVFTPRRTPVLLPARPSEELSQEKSEKDSGKGEE